MTENTGDILATRQVGQKRYELKDHLGNVRALVSDRKLANGDAEVLSANNYYPFGMLHNGNRLNSEEYRFGFNGKEMDNNMSGGVTGAIYDYGFRIYDARIAKFLSVDPLTKSYPWYTPYQFAGNMPIAAIDLDGLEEHVVIYSKNEDGATCIQVTTYIENKRGVIMQAHPDNIKSQKIIKFIYHGDGKVSKPTFADKFTGKEKEAYDKSRVIGDEFKMTPWGDKEGTFRMVTEERGLKIFSPSPPSSPPSPDLVKEKIDLRGVNVVHRETREPISIGWVDWNSKAERDRFIGFMVNQLDEEISELNGELKSISVDVFVNYLTKESKTALQEKFNIENVEVNWIQDGDRGENNSNVYLNATVEYIPKE